MTHRSAPTVQKLLVLVLFLVDGASMGMEVAGCEGTRKSFTHPAPRFESFGPFCVSHHP